MFTRFRSDRRGVAGIEFAMLVPLMIIGVFGTYELGRYVRVATRADDAAEMLADIVAQQASVSSSSMANFCTGAQLTMTPFTGTALKAAVASVTYSTSSQTRVSNWEDDSCGNAAAMSNEVTLATSLTPNPGDSAIVVTVTYSYTPSIAVVLAKSFTIKRIAYARPRSGTTVSHS
jgi:Flp pilus assembly protein TadG